MKMCKLIKLLLLLFAWYGCTDDDEKGQVYDSSQPVVIHSFAPDSGGIATKMVIKGENFGRDTSKVKVFFNKKQATVLSAGGDILYVLVPKQPGDSSVISVKVEDQDVNYDGKRFIYKISARVSTLVGKVAPDGSSESKDGSVSEATLQKPYFLTVDWEKNIFFTEDIIGHKHKVRLLSEKDDQVITMVDGSLSRIWAPTVSNDYKRVYISRYDCTGAADQYIYRMDPERQWQLEPLKTGNPGLLQWVAALAIDENEILYEVDYDGTLVQIDCRLKESKVLARLSSSKEYYVAYDKKYKRLYIGCDDTDDIKYYDFATQTIKPFAGIVGDEGHQDGPGAEAKFNDPTQLAVDQDGNVYVGDASNHVVRKITPEGFVSTLAGVPGKKGYLDGKPEESLFNWPGGVAVDQDGVVYVCDYNNHRIRKIVVE